MKEYTWKLKLYTQNQFIFIFSSEHFAVRKRLREEAELRS